MIRHAPGCPSKYGPNVVATCNCGAVHERAIILAAFKWRESLESDGWTDEDIKHGTGRPGMKEMMEAVDALDKAVTKATD